MLAVFSGGNLPVALGTAANDPCPCISTHGKVGLHFGVIERLLQAKTTNTCETGLTSRSTLTRVFHGACPKLGRWKARPPLAR